MSPPSIAQLYCWTSIPSGWTGWSKSWPHRHRGQGEGDLAQHALALIEEHGPSLFVTSIEMSDGEMDGLECLSLAKQRAPELKVIVLSAYGDPQYVDAALAAGAEAYV